MKRLLILLLLLTSSCALEIDDMNTKPVQGDKRILDPAQYGLLGQQLKILANYDTSGGVGVVNTDPNTLIVPKVAPAEVSATYVQKFLNASRNINALNQFAPSIITLAIEATPTKMDDDNVGLSRTSLLQGVLKFGTGMANQGTQSSTPLAFANISLDPRIIFDIAEGTMLSFPAAFFQLDYLYTTVIENGFQAAGDAIGPDYQVVYSLGYEPSARVRPTTMTQLLPQGSLESGAGSTYFFRPKYSTSVYFLWKDWTDPGSPPAVLDVAFFAANGTILWEIPAYPAGTLPPSEIPWPADAVAVSVSQSSGAPYELLRCVSILEF